MIRQPRYKTWRYPFCGLRPQLVRGVAVLYPGLPVCIVIALAAHFIAGRHGGTEILLAVLLGMVLSPLHRDSLCQPGISFAARPLLQFGIALLGARITVEQISGDNARMLCLVLATVPATLVTGLVLGRLLRLPVQASLMGAVAVAICGASAVLAVAATLPRDQLDQRYVLGIIVGATGLGTLAMIMYPLVASALGFSEVETGVFLGATIHDVAQAAGSGYMVSENVGDVATVTKLMRVAMLVPVVAIIALWCRSASSAAPKLPWFLLGFFVIVLLNSFGYLAEAPRAAMVAISRECLLIAMAALGMKTSIPAFLKLGWRPVAQLTATSILLAVAAGFAVQIPVLLG